MGLKVCKFGGTSLATADQIRKVCNIVLNDPERRIVALSAPGKRDGGDTKVTDLLIACAEDFLRDGSAEDACNRVADRFNEIATGLGLDNETRDSVIDGLQSRLALSTNDPERFTDGLKALGEEHCARLVAAYLASQGHEAQYVDPKESGMLLSDEAGNARVLPVAYKRLSELRERSGILVFPGFFGYTPSGHLVTFPRGGTDITGAVLAAAVEADLYENFSDIDCVYAAHPAAIDSPVPINTLTYAEMRELAYIGFNVFHDEALEPVFRAGVPVRVCNTNNPSAPGTRVVAKREKPASRPVTGIAHGSGFCSIFVSKYLMNRERGFGRHLLQIIEETGLSYEHMPSGIDSISVITRPDQFDPEAEEIIVERIKAELEPDSIDVERDLTLVMVVGEAMRSTVGLASRATSALAGAGVNIEMLNQGSSEISIMFGVKDRDADKAVTALYNEFLANAG